MELAAWVERVMNPLKLADIPVVDYNVVCNAVIQLGEREGERLVKPFKKSREIMTSAWERELQLTPAPSDGERA